MIPSLRAPLRTTTTRTAASLSLVPARSASRLSAIHNGLRRSGGGSSAQVTRGRRDRGDKFQKKSDGDSLLSPDAFRAELSGGSRGGGSGFKPASVTRTGFGGGFKPESFTRGSVAPRDKKGRKIEGPLEPQSRSGRYYSDEHSFGKQSLAYQVNNNPQKLWGAVKDMIAEEKAKAGDKAGGSAVATEEERPAVRRAGVVDRRDEREAYEKSTQKRPSFFSNNDTPRRSSSFSHDDTPRRSSSFSRDDAPRRPSSFASDDAPRRPSSFTRTDGDNYRERRPARAREEEDMYTLPSRWKDRDEENDDHEERSERAGSRSERRAARKSGRDEEPVEERRPSRFDEEPRRRPSRYDEDADRDERPARRSREEPAGRSREEREGRYGEFRDDAPRRRFEEDTPRRRYEEDAPRRRFGQDDTPRRRYDEDAPRSRDGQRARRSFDDEPLRERGWRSRDDPQARPFEETTLAPSRAREYFKDSRPSSWRERDGASGPGPLANEEIDSKAYRNTFPLSVEYTTASSQFIYGRSAVRSALYINRRKLYKLYVLRGQNRSLAPKDSQLMRVAETRGIIVKEVEDQRFMDKLSQGRPHNGFVIEASPLPVPPVVALSTAVDAQTEKHPNAKGDKRPRFGFHVILGHQTKEEIVVNGLDTFVPTATPPPKGAKRGRNPLVLVLDNLVDPGNVGALLRSASFLGVSAVCITSEGSSSINPTSIKAAAGAAEELRMFTVTTPLTEFIRISRESGWKVFAAVAPPSGMAVRAGLKKRFMTPYNIEAEGPLYDSPCMVVLGNEGLGLSNEVKGAADVQVYIPHGTRDLSLVDSLNVSVAGAVLSHSFLKFNKAKADEGLPVPGQKKERQETGQVVREEMYEEESEEAYEADVAREEWAEEESTEEALEGEAQDNGHAPKKTPKDTEKSLF